MNRPTSNSQILMFPTPGDPPEGGQPRPRKRRRLRVYDPAAHGHSDSKNSAEPKQESSATPEIVLCGSFRRDPQALRNDYQELQDLGFNILSPTNIRIASEKDGFVFMQGEEAGTPEAIELRHLEAIRRASFVWLHAPDGYVGTSAALEVGFARASGIPVYSRNLPKEVALAPLVTAVASPNGLLSSYAIHPEPPLPAVKSFQTYYARAAARRGYEQESAEDTLLLMLEEFGELARAIRKRQRLRRDAETFSNEEQELADVFIYVVHMANVLGIDLSEAVHAKEHMNIQRFLSR